MNKKIFLGNDLRIQTTILEVTDGIYRDITLDNMFNWHSPTGNMMKESVYDVWLTLDELIGDYLADGSAYKGYAKLIVVESKVDEINIYSYDCYSNESWKLFGTLTGYGFQ